MEKINYDRFIIIIILAALLAISVAGNIGFGIRSGDAVRLRESQHQSERTIAALTEELGNSRRQLAEARGVIAESNAIVSNALSTVTTTGTTLAKSIEIINKCIAALKNIEILHNRFIDNLSDGLDTVSD